MADLGRNGPLERDVEQAITALKKGAQLLKYGRRGKPKFCPFRLLNDESTLIWFSGKEEKHLRLNSVTRIVPGQRTANFQRYPRPEKEYQSFSLIYGSDQSLDLICKDKDEAEVWFVGLKALLPGGQLARLKFDSKSEGLSSDVNSPATWSRISPASSPFGSTENLRQDGGETYKMQSPYGSPPRHGLQKGFGGSASLDSKLFVDSGSLAGSLHSVGSDVGTDSLNMQLRGFPMDAFRVSMSSAVSSSSQGSAQDEGDALGDVFMWGEGIGEGILGGGVYPVGMGAGLKVDALLPKALESAVVLDVHNIACGAKHAALVTKQGEVFCWGEESGGRLGHGVDVDVPHPRLIDALATTNTELVACGEYHTCGISLSGDLYTWGDGTHSYGLLGHGNNISHWMPKRVGGPLEGIRVSSVACGPWHTALVTSAGQLFTFGDGTFGVLGHGDRKSISLPREIESLKGLKTVRVACGVWHTAAVVEVMVGYTNSSNCSSGKLFTWGDGDKGRLGHGDKEQKLVPTCVAALVDYNFRQVACGHSLTVSLTTAGRVFTMGSSIYGQLGNPRADGKLPGLVEGRLADAFVEEISCGAYHVTVLTGKTEVFTWGKGANGRLGHGDVLDRNLPTLVEALKDKQVKSVACGSSFTAAICLHKWVSGADQSMCSGCRQAFGFTRKRHNCYNCGHAFCHSCSARKSLKASLAPNPNKTYRVCDPCFLKLKKGIEGGAVSTAASAKRNVMVRRPGDIRDKADKVEFKVPKPPPPSVKGFTMEQAKSNEMKGGAKQLKLEPSIDEGVPIFETWGAVDIPAFFNPNVVPMTVAISAASVPPSRSVSRSVSPLSRRPSPPRSTTPTPTLGGLTASKSILEDLKRTNEVLNQEMLKLRAQIEEITNRLQLKDMELQHSARQVQEAIAMAGEETAKCQAAKEVIKSLTAQLKDMAERVPAGSYRHPRPGLVPLYSQDIPNGLQPIGVTDAHEEGNLSNHFKYNGNSPASTLRDISSNGINSPREAVSGLPSRYIAHSGTSDSEVDRPETARTNREAGIRVASSENGGGVVEAEAEWVEQDQPGVYITLCALPGGLRDLRRVRFSRKRFSEKQAEQWWLENRQRVHEQYNVRSSNTGAKT